jgi:hypothetical protein
MLYYVMMWYDVGLTTWQVNSFRWLMNWDETNLGLGILNWNWHPGRK